MKTLLQIVQQFCKVTGLIPPTSVVGSSDDQIVQILALINEGLDELAVKYKWTQLKRLGSFTTVALENQGALATLAPGYKSLVPGTLWDGTSKLPAHGAITPQDSQTLRIWGQRTATPAYREIQGQLHIIPAPAAGHSVSFEYNSQFLVRAADGVTLKQYFDVDTDICLLPDNLISLDLRWRWKSEKGLPYAEHMRTFESVCKQAYVDSLGAANLTMANPTPQARPGIVIPAGSWQQ